MKYKSIAAVAVLAMFLASSFCVLAVAEDNNGAELREVSTTPLIIDSTGVTSGNLEDFNATYDNKTHTLTLNGGVEVDCTCTNDHPYIIDAKMDDLTIIVNGTTVLKSDDAVYSDAGAIRLLATQTSAYDDNGILTIKGEGTLKLIPPYSSNSGWTCNAIESWYVNVIKCNLIIDGTHVSTGNFRGIDSYVAKDKNSSISIIDATVKITGCERYCISNGLCCNRNITIQNSVVEIDKIVEGIIGIDGRVSGSTEGTCTFINSEVTINGFDNEERSSSIGIGTVNINSTILTATTGDVTGGNKKNAVNINADTVNVNDSILELTTKKGDHTSCIEFATVMTVKHSRIHCNSSVGNTADCLSDYDACIKTTSKSILSVEGSEITAKNNRNCTKTDNVFGILTNFVFVNSTFDVSSVNKAFAKSASDGGVSFDFTVAIDTSSITALKGSDDGQNWTDITNTADIFNYKNVKGNKINTVIFDLNGGDGSAVPVITNLKTGDKITLPQCDAKKDGKVFIGWNDGKNIYKPGTEYTVEGDTTLYAYYGDAPGNDNTGIIIAIVVIVVIAILAIIGFVWYKRN